MLHRIRLALLVFFCTLPASADSAVVRVNSATSAESHQTEYYWRSIPVANTAQLLTLFCRACGTGSTSGEDIPLVAVLRDTLGEASPETDRLSYVWLLSYEHPNLGQRLLSAVPFFYWRIDRGASAQNEEKI